MAEGDTLPGFELEPEEKIDMGGVGECACSRQRAGFLTDFDTNLSGFE